MRKTLGDQIAPLLDNEEYPRRWGEYVGQKPAKRMLQVAAQSARLRGQPLEHVLIGHPTAGIGKTSLASLVAAELKTPARIVSGPMALSKARMLFSEMHDREVLVYDEFHQVLDGPGGKKGAEWLLPFLQDGVLRGPLGPEAQPRITVVATTTEAGRLPETIVSRFPLQPPMSNYTDEEAAKVALIMAPRLLGDLPRLTRREAAQIALASHNNPRAIRRMLLTLRDLTITAAVPRSNNHYDIAGLLEWQGVTPDGLDALAQRYLLTLATEFDGAAGAQALEDRLSLAGGLAPVERVLMDKGLVARTRSGRMLTQAGIARVHALHALAG